MKSIHLFFILFLIWSCDQQQILIIEKGTLEGKVNIGPLCPVVSNPPDPACQPTEETYNNWPIIIWSIDKNTKIAKIKPNSDGDYKIDLPKGSYIVNLEKQHNFDKNLPVTIEIRSGETLLLNINIDTGIR